MQDTALVNVLLPALLAFIMIGMGTTLTPEDFGRVLRQPRAALVALFGQLLVLPLLGFALASTLDLSPTAQIGLILVACCPGGTMSNLICHLARGNVALSISLTAFSSVITLVSIPLIMGAAIAYFGGQDHDLTMPVKQTMLTLFGIVLVPVMIGMIVRGHAPNLAERSEKFFSVSGLLLMIALVIGVSISERETLPAALVEIGPGVLALNLLAVTVGLTLARMFRLGRRESVTLAIEVGIQNSSLAILIALSVIQSAALAVPAGVYGLLMYGSAGLIIFWSRRHGEPRSSAVVGT